MPVIRNSCEILEIAATTKIEISPHERAGGVQPFFHDIQVRSEQVDGVAHAAILTERCFACNLPFNADAVPAVGVIGLKVKRVQGIVFPRPTK